MFGALCVLMSTKIFDLISDRNLIELENTLASGGNPNEVYSENPDDNEYGITPIFLATIKGDLDAVNLLIKFGADVNFQIPDEHMASDTYASNVLSLALQARFLMSDEKYAPIVETLERNGAIDDT